MIIARAQMLQALEAVKGAVADKTFQPILTHVAVEGQLLMGFDSEIGISVKLPVDTGVKFNAPFDTLFNLLKALEADELSIEIKGKTLAIECGKHRSTLQQIEEEFPKPRVKDIEAIQWQVVPTGLKESLERAAIGASSNDQEKLYSCIVIDGLYVYATDRAKLVRCKMEGPALGKMLLSRNSAAEIVRLGQPLKVGMAGGGWAMWDYGDLQLLTMLREGINEFPPVGEKMAEIAAKLPPCHNIPAGMLAILSRLGLFCGSGSKRVVIKTGVMGTAFEASNEISACSEFVDIQAPEGKAFNPMLLAQGVPCAEVISWGNETRDPIYLKGNTVGFEFMLSPLIG